MSSQIFLKAPTYVKRFMWLFLLFFAASVMVDAPVTSAAPIVSCPSGYNALGRQTRKNGVSSIYYVCAKTDANESDSDFYTSITNNAGSDARVICESGEPEVSIVGNGSEEVFFSSGAGAYPPLFIVRATCPNADSFNANVTSYQQEFDTVSGEPVDGSGGSGPTAEGISPEIDDWLNRLLALFSALVGIGLVISFIVAGIQYTTAGSNASQVSAAKTRIYVTVIAFFLYAFAFTFLQWLIPGGIFS